jgi:hypothetical protein
MLTLDFQEGIMTMMEKRALKRQKRLGVLGLE